MWRRILCGLMVCAGLAMGILSLGKEEETVLLTQEEKNERVMVREVRFGEGAVEKEEEEGVYITVFDAERGETREAFLEDYLVNVLAGEMPAGYETEALKAQTVAARTYIVRKMEGNGCRTRADADVCTDSRCCMAYWDEKTMKERWGSEYEAYRRKLDAAVRETEGEILCYDGEPIEALFHASSSGFTEDAVAVWGEAYPYLKSVESGEKAEKTEQVLSKKKLVEVLNAAFPKAKCTEGGIEKQLEIVSVSGSGRVEQVRVGKTTTTGKRLRELLGLRSTAFAVGFSGENAVFTVSGYGHGVGLSQLGAQTMAKEGADYREILLHYYSGVEITGMRE